jgi:hypothetical protein
MTIDISNNDPRISYSVAQGVTQTSFAVPFEFFDDSDVNVYVDGTLKTITTDYTISGGGGSTGTVTISVTGATGGSVVVLTRDITIERTTDFTAGADINRAALNTQLDTLTAIAADVKDSAELALRYNDQTVGVSTELPVVDTLKGKTLAFNASTGAPEAGPTAADVANAQTNAANAAASASAAASSASAAANSAAAAATFDPASIAITGGTIDNTVIGGSTPAAVNGTTLTVGSINYPSSGPLSNRNKIINGSMTIDQRNAGAAVTAINTQYLVDRWWAWLSQASKITAQQNAGGVTPPAGFPTYQGITSSSAYSVLTSDYFALVQHVEAINFTDLAWGTADAKPVTLSFWVRSSLTGTFGGAFANAAQNRSYPFSYTINSANTWEYITITVAGDTSGTWEGATNGIGVRVQFGLGVGSSNSNTAGAWYGANYISATGATSVVGTSGATFYLTGVQLEAGDTATPFEHRSYGAELALCQRYYWRTSTLGGAWAQIGAGVVYSPTDAYAIVRLPCDMRASPTCSYSGGTGEVQTVAGGLALTSTTATAIAEPTPQAFRVDTVFSGGTTGHGCFVRMQHMASNYFDADAEL